MRLFKFRSFDLFGFGEYWATAVDVDHARRLIVERVYHHEGPADLSAKLASIKPEILDLPLVFEVYYDDNVSILEAP